MGVSLFLFQKATKVSTVKATSFCLQAATPSPIQASNWDQTLRVQSSSPLCQVWMLMKSHLRPSPCRHFLTKRSLQTSLSPPSHRQLSIVKLCRSRNSPSSVQHLWVMIGLQTHLILSVSRMCFVKRQSQTHLSR